MKTLWYYFIKIIIKSSLFFYTKKIKVIGKENIPAKGAVFFMVNHPNGLIDPLIVAVNNPRIQHFLVRASTFKKPFVKKFLESLNLMPIYRIRDGFEQLNRNQKIFEQCFSILNNQKALMIFPEGSHDKRRTIRPLSKGFSRIIFGALEKNPSLKIYIIPVGITYQNPSVYPTKVCVRYGTPIVANDYYKVDKLNTEIRRLIQAISNQLKNLAVHIPADENYLETLKKLQFANVDFTEVDKVNTMVKSRIIHKQKRTVSFLGFLKPIIIFNSIIPWLLWKYTERKINEFEFIDTFRYGIGTLAFGFFYTFQSFLMAYFFNWKTGFIYLTSSLFIVLLYSKFYTIQEELPLE